MNHWWFINNTKNNYQINLNYYIFNKITLKKVEECKWWPFLSFSLSFKFYFVWQLKDSTSRDIVTNETSIGISALSWQLHCIHS